jgi:hypothetical protein
LPKKRQAELARPTKPPTLVPESGPVSSDTATPSHLLNTSLSSAFETPHLGLLVAKGFVNSAPCKILFDNGAEISYLSNRLAKHLQAETKEENQHATFANGTTTPLHQTVVPVNLRIEGYTESIYLAVCPLSSYDVILGKQWLSKYDPIISHKTNEITFQFQNQNVTIQANLERHKPLFSASTFSRVIRCGYKTFALLLKPEEPSILPNTPAPPVQSILDEFADVFPEGLPKDLPPQRSHDFKIELQPDALPIKRGHLHFTAYQPKKLRNSRNS